MLPTKRVCMLPSTSAADGAAPEELEARCRLLDRVASEVSRLQFYAARGQVRDLMLAC